ncbi:MAG TPA: PRC-barrel domain-containing protein [Thermomicrobiales bacterium]|jgi:sporulation protein YlmC with PRC-barrel domain
MAVIPFEQMRAMPVVDQHDVLVGLVDDVVVDLEASDIYYVVVQPAGVLEGQGLGRARLAIPLRAFETLPDCLRLPRDAATISKMPRVAPDQPGYGSKEYEAKIFGYWGVGR